VALQIVVWWKGYRTSIFYEGTSTKEIANRSPMFDYGATISLLYLGQNFFFFSFER